MNHRRVLPLLLLGSLVFFLICTYFTPFEPLDNDVEEEAEATTGETGSPPLPECAVFPPKLLGRRPIDKTFPPIGTLESRLRNVRSGGEWKPKECKAVQKVAIIVPYRNRWAHLRGFLANLHPFLQRQQIHYRIFVINQALPVAKPKDTFNKAKLMNVGFTEVMQMQGRRAWDCVIFHDVDTIPENDFNLYRCEKGLPKRLFRRTEENQYHHALEKNMGGIAAFEPDVFRRINGYSNSFWGWGTEDTDMYSRVVSTFNLLVLPPAEIGTYSSLELARKAKDASNPPGNVKCREILRNTSISRRPLDGLNSLEGFYRLREVREHTLFTNISVDLLMEESKRRRDYPCKGLEIPSYTQKEIDWLKWEAGSTFEALRRAPSVDE